MKLPTLQQRKELGSEVRKQCTCKPYWSGETRICSQSFFFLINPNLWVKEASMLFALLLSWWRGEYNFPHHWKHESFCHHVKWLRIKRANGLQTGLSVRHQDGKLTAAGGSQCDCWGSWKRVCKQVFLLFEAALKLQQLWKKNMVELYFISG